MLLVGVALGLFSSSSLLFCYPRLFLRSDPVTLCLRFCKLSGMFPVALILFGFSGLLRLPLSQFGGFDLGAPDTRGLCLLSRNPALLSFCLRPFRRDAFSFHAGSFCAFRLSLLSRNPLSLSALGEGSTTILEGKTLPVPVLPEICD